MPEEKNKQDILFEEYRKNLLKPSEEEIKLNRPSRSAKLRFATRSTGEFINPINFINKFKKILDLESLNVK